MAVKTPITVLEEFDGSTVPDEVIDIIGLEFDILDEQINFHIGLTDTHARLDDIVPFARKLSDRIIHIVLEKLHRDGKSVSCQKGCSFCCSYLVPMSVPEVFSLNRLVFSIPPENREKILQPLIDAANKIINEKNENPQLNKLLESKIELEQFSKWYSSLDMACPFLCDGACAIYPQRPMACREYIVTSPSVLCRGDGADEPDIVQMPVSILEALSFMTAELRQSSLEAMMLPLALPWAQENLQLAEQTWPATVMIEKFAEIVKKMVAKTYCANEISSNVC